MDNFFSKAAKDLTLSHMWRWAMCMCVCIYIYSTRLQAACLMIPMETNMTWESSKQQQNYVTETSGSYEVILCYETLMQHDCWIRLAAPVYIEACSWNLTLWCAYADHYSRANGIHNHPCSCRANGEARCLFMSVCWLIISGNIWCSHTDHNSCTNGIHQHACSWRAQSEAKSLFWCPLLCWTQWIRTYSSTYVHTRVIDGYFVPII